MLRGHGNPVTALAFRGLSSLYGGVAGMRRTWYERHPEARRRLERPVVSVGNVAVGGTGKTPVVAAIARLLLAHGHRPAILSRGYARRTVADGVVVVSDHERLLADVDVSGDEPLMLARQLPGVPVLVAEDRYVAGRFAERRLGATVHVLDDGFQHLHLDRTVDLVLLTSADLQDAVLPSGRLRERVDAVRLVDAVLVQEAPEEATRVGTAVSVPTTFVVVTDVGELRWSSGGSEPLPTPRARVVAVAGIARPSRFFDTLTARGYNVVERMAFPDHHAFSRGDIGRVSARARAVDGLVVTTEKDAVRLPADVRWAVLPLTARIEPVDAFDSWLLARL